MVNYLLRLGAKMLLAGLASMAMYCIWIDTVAPESQRIVQLFVLAQYGVYCLSILLIFHLGRPQKVVDILFPPLIALAFPVFFWNVPDGLLIFSFVSMLIASCVFSASNAFMQRLLAAPYSFPKFSRTMTLSLIGLAIVFVTLIFFAERSDELSWLHILLWLAFLGVFVLLHLGTFFYPIFILWFFQERRKWKVWVLFLTYSAVWIAFIVQTYPVNEWRMQTFVDPCYHESMGFDNADYQIISGRVCVQPPGIEGPFNISIRKTLEGADATTFEQISDSSYHRDSQHIFYDDRALPVDRNNAIVLGQFLVDNGRLFKNGEMVDIEKETKSFQPEDKSFSLQYIDSLFTPQQGDFPVHVESKDCVATHYVWNSFRWGYRYSVSTTNGRCLFSPGEDDIFVEQKSIDGIPGKLYQHQFDMIWLSESCGGIAYRVISPRDWDEFFLPKLSLQNRCQKK